MKDEKDILADAIAQLRKEAASAQPPQSVVEQTMKQLAEAEAQSTYEPPCRTIPFAALCRPAVRWTAVAAALILTGYTIGRLTTPAPPEYEQLRDSLGASLAPALRRKLIGDMEQRYQLALANTYVQIKEELSTQSREDLNRFAAQMLAASNATTNRLLAELVDAMRAEQNKDLRKVAAALYELERKRLADREELTTDLAALAYQTEDELRRTRKNFVQLLAHTYSAEPQDRLGNDSRDPNERS